MHKENKSNNSGIGFFGLLQIAFIILKLCKVIKWSWIWVFIPTYIWVVITVVIISIYSFLLGKKRR